MRSVPRIAAWVAALLLGLPVLLLVVLLSLGNTELGRGWIAALAPRLTGGSLAFSGLEGRFPDRLRVAELELRDADGTYARLRDVAVDWHPLALLGGEAKLDRLGAANLTLLRLPRSSDKNTDSSGGLPVRLVVD